MVIFALLTNTVPDKKMPNNTLNLRGFAYAELFHSEGLFRLDQAFLATLHPDLRKHLIQWRQENEQLTQIEISKLLLECATSLDTFLTNLFNIEEEAAVAQAKTLSHNPISAFKKYFVMRRARKNILKCNELPAFSELNDWLSKQLENAPSPIVVTELGIIKEPVNPEQPENV